MNDKHFEQWTEILGEFREARIEEIHRNQQEKGIKFEPARLFKIYSNQMGTLLSKWWDLEKESWEESPPADTKLGVDSLKNELESLVEIELEKIKEEIAETKETEPSWKAEDIEDGQNSFEKIIRDLIVNYSIKIENLSGRVRKDPTGVALGRPVSARYNSSSAPAGGFWFLFMFGLGLLLGAAPTVYYWDLAHRAEEKVSQDVSQLSIERKSLIEKLSVLQEAYRSLAYGKIKNIPDTEKAIQPIRQNFAEKKEQLEKEYIRKQAELIKKIPAGDRLDKSLENLKEAHEKDKAQLESEEQSQIDPLLKDLKKHKTILEGSE